MYLLNKNKYWTEASPEELEKELDMDQPDEDTHRILQHKLRSINFLLYSKVFSTDFILLAFPPHAFNN